MKIYEYKAFPHPRRVRMFLVEKNINAEYVQVDVPAGEHKQEPFISKNPDGAVPFLELDCGTCVSETLSICRYFEEANPNNPLLGITPKEKAVIDMWLRRIDGTLMNTTSSYFHHATDGLGDEGRYRNKDWGQRNLSMLKTGLQDLNAHLTDKDFIVNNSFSLVDITALCALDFALFLEIVSLDEHANVKRWYDSVSGRPSAAA